MDELRGRHGFVALAAHPYDPARVLRAGLRAVRGGRPRPPAASAAGACAVSASEAGPPVAGGRPGGGLRALARRALYSEPAVRLLGHMLLVDARRA